jgi:integrase
MPAPIRRAGSPFYWFRKKVPTRLRKLVGRTEVWLSLETADKRAAVVRCAELSADLERDWSKLAADAEARELAAATDPVRDEPIAEDGPMPDVPEAPVPAPMLTHQDAHALRGVVHVRLRDRLVASPPTGFAAVRTVARDDDDLRAEARAILQQDGVDFSDGDVERFVPLLAAARADAADDARRALAGDYSPNPILARLPQRVAPELDLVRAFEEYAAKGGLKGGKDGPTAKRWRPKIRLFVAWIGHRDLARMTPDDAYRWVDHLIDKKFSRKSIKAVWVASLSATAGFMTERRKLKSANPFKSIVVRDGEASDAAQPRQKGFSQSEAIAILTATFLPASHLTSIETKAARRWLPWLCAYSGARVNELTSLHAGDVTRDPVSGVWVMVVKPSLEKTAQWRTVPIHSHVIQQGFLDYVESRRKLRLPLFYDPARSRGATAGNPIFKKAAERLAEWLHSLGLVPDGVQPSHAWRHLFKSTARHVGMDREVEGFITGHRPKDSGASAGYGDRWVATMSAEIEKYPRFAVDGAGVVARKKSRRSPDAIAADDAAKAARKATRATRAA